jgi:hypothetical protein
MKFMMHMNVPGGRYQMSGWSPDDIKAMIAFMHGFNADLKARGQLVVAEGLVDPDQTRMVRADDGGRPVVTDGPFAESKEFIAGFWIVEVKNEQEAYDLAARVSLCPGPGGKPLHMPLELRAVGGPPPTD